jgi:hypothetical protein
MFWKFRIALLPLLFVGASTCTAQFLLNGPETVVFDSVEQRYFVSNMYAPYSVVEIDKYGSYRIFNSTDMNSPHGMTIAENTLWVACPGMSGNGSLIGLDLESGELTHSLYFGSFTNGLTADTSGNIWMTTSYGVYKIRLADLQTTLTAGGITIPNGLHFEARKNRVLIPSEVHLPHLYTVDVSDMSVSTQSLYPGRYSCITEDHLNNLYISTFFQDQVLRFDSSLSDSPEVVAYGNGPEGIFFNKRYSTLVVPHMLDHSIAFIPMDLDLWMTCDTTFGWEPLEVSFAPSADQTITDWHWDFGDGSVSSAMNPTHLYEDPGLYDVSLYAVTPGGDTLRRTYPCHVSCLGDSLWTDSPEIDDSDFVELQIMARNFLPLDGMTVPVRYSGDLNLELDSFSTQGCRAEFFAVQDSVYFDEGEKHIVFSFKPRAYGSPLYLDPGSGAVIKMYFHDDDGLPGRNVAISLEGANTPHQPLFSSADRVYAPILRGGIISRPPCCGVFTGGLTGNVNCSEDGKLTLSDITRLIDFVFVSKDPLCCEENGNVNGSSDSKITLSDITRLIDHVFVSKAETETCQ